MTIRYQKYVGDSSIELEGKVDDVIKVLTQIDESQQRLTEEQPGTIEYNSLDGVIKGIWEQASKFTGDDNAKQD